MRDLSWAERVFHVLAHVRATAHLAPSVYDEAWIRRAEAVLGPADARPLGEDAATIGALAPDHDRLARVQLVAWLFDGDHPPERCADRELRALSADDVAAPELLAPLVALGPVAEVLRAAAELEDLSALPARGDFDEVRALLAARAHVAPALARLAVEGVRSLRLRGRVRGARVWVGVPDDELPAQHPTWQALHEATVAEVHAALGDVAHAPLEQAASALLAHRADAAGLRDEHRRWLAHFGRHAPDLDPAHLPAPTRGRLGL